MSTTLRTLHADDQARRWLAAQASARPWVIDYDVHRCCGGGKICQVNVRQLKANERRDGHLPAELESGITFLIDPRVARRLPPTICLTVRGIGPLKHLDLDLSGEQWGELLYS
jgi:hypothetical protein